MRKIQISVFVPNKKGELKKVTRLLAENDINLNALSIAETHDFGVLRMLVSDTDKAYDVLTRNSFIAKKTPILIIKDDDKPGSLNRLLEKLFEAGITLEYIYSSAGSDVYLVIKVDDIDKAETVLG
jgi:hypothetical protein